MQRRKAAPKQRGIASALLDWYARERRDLPWRAAPDEVPDPYRVWLSEIMLQQTTVKAVIPRYATFLQQWPNVKALASAELGQVLAAWAGLGYYARARNVHACARAVVTEHGGKFPERAAALRKLPGVGDYTASAIAAIAFGERTAPVDGNIERVVARLFAVATPLPQAKAEIKRLAETLTPAKRPGDFAQAMMDLGAAICTPRRPACARCPLHSECRALAQGLAETLPYRAPKRERPTRYGTAFVAIRSDGAVLLRKRPLKGLLGGMLETPSSPWEEGRQNQKTLRNYAPLKAKWHKLAGQVEHSFTHFQLELSIYRADVGLDAKPKRAARPEASGFVARRDLARAALPSLMRKVLNHAFAAKTSADPETKAEPRASRAPVRARRRSA